MENKMLIFESDTFGTVRTISENGKVLFCGSDVAKALGYVNTSKAINTHCKGVTKRYTLTNGGEQEINFIPEGDIYRLIVSSKLPEAQKFESWVFDDVVPSIKKHGLYATDELLANPDIAIAAFTALKEERAKRKLLESTVAVQVQQIAELTPKAGYYDVILNCKDLLSITKIAKDYGKSGKWLNEKLRELGVQYRQGDIWLLYQKYAKQGYTSTKTHDYLGSDGQNHAKVHTYWTQKGRLFLYNLLKEVGILPIIEIEAIQTA